MKASLQKRHLPVHISLISNAHITNQILVFGFLGSKKTIVLKIFPMISTLLSSNHYVKNVNLPGGFFCCPTMSCIT